MLPPERPRFTPDELLQKLTVLHGRVEMKFLLTRDPKWAKSADRIAQAAQKISASREFQAQRPK